MNETHALAEFGAGFPTAQIPAEVIHLSERCFLDYLGISLAGWDEAPVRIAHVVAEEQGGAEQASLLGGGRSALIQAALVNGIASHVLDFDDTHDPTILHGTGPVMSAALAAAEVTDASGLELLAAHATGFEVAARVALAVHPHHYDRGFHVTGTAGTLGAAAAAGRLLGLDRETMAHALSTASAQAAGLREMFGSMTKSLHAGKAAANGLLSALLAQRGWTSASAGLEGSRGYWAVLSPEANPDRATQALGESWELRQNGIKPYACGVVTHPTIDAVRRLSERAQLPVDEIAEIRCWVNPYVVELTGKREPRTGLEAKFSIYHCAAVAYIDRAARLRQFSDDAVQRGDVTSLQRRVQVEVDESLPTSAARVQLQGKDGRRWQQDVSAATGTPHNPLSDEDLLEKFLDLAVDRLGSAGAREVAKHTLASSGLSKVRELTALLLRLQKL